MMRKRNIIMLVSSLLLLVISAKAKAQTTPKITKDSPAFLKGEWMLSVMNDKKIRACRTTLYIDLSERRIGGKTFCNSYFANIDTLTSSDISFSHIGSTRVACQELNLEDEFFKALSNVKHFKKTKYGIAFTDEKYNITLSFLPLTSSDKVQNVDSSAYVDTLSSIITDREVYEKIVKDKHFDTKSLQTDSSYIETPKPKAKSDNFLLRVWNGILSIFR